MKLYYMETLNPQKACAVAKHLGSPVEFVRVDLTKGENKRPAFLAINPNGKVTALENGATKLWEADAIMCHLARKAGSDLWPSDSERQVEVMRWLSWNTHHFMRHTSQLYFEHIIRPMFGLGAPDAKAIDEAVPFIKRFGTVLNDHLRGREYLVGDKLSVADFAVAITLPYTERAKIPLGEFAEISRWHARLNELPAWREPFPSQRAHAA